MMSQMPRLRVVMQKHNRGSNIFSQIRGNMAIYRTDRTETEVSVRGQSTGVTCQRRIIRGEPEKVMFGLVTFFFVCLTQLCQNSSPIILQ